MKRIIITILLIMALFPAGVVMASDISDADYMATVRVTNNSTAASIVGVPISGANTTNLINQGFLNATTNNSAIRSNAGADVPFMPGYNQDWIMFVESIGASTITDYTWYNNSTGGEIRYFPDTAGMTVSDDASLEVGDNWTISINNIYIDTDNGTDKNIIRKDDAITVTTDNITSGNVTATIYDNQFYQFDNSDTEAVGSWTQTTPTVARSADLAHTGTYSLKFTGTNPAANQTLSTWDNSWRGTEVTITVWIYSVLANTASVRIYDGVNTTSSGFINNAGSWIQASVTKTLGAAATELTCSLVVGGTTTNYYDDVELTGLPYELSTTLTGITSGEYDIAVAMERRP